MVELWQADARGKYRHPADMAAPARDPKFQGYGRTATDEAGGFRFRTIRPPAYLIALPAPIGEPRIFTWLFRRGVCGV